jgi:hypothetical protein
VGRRAERTQLGVARTKRRYGNRGYGHEMMGYGRDMEIAAMGARYGNRGY